MHDITASLYWKQNKRHVLKNVRNNMKRGMSLNEAMAPTLEHVEYCFKNGYIWPDSNTTIERIQRDIYGSI